MGKENSMEKDIIAISMVIRLMNAKRNQNLKANVTNVRNMDTNQILNLVQIVKALFG